VGSLGAASDDLSAFNNAIAAGDQYLASGVTDGNVLGEFSSAVQAFQAGAHAAVGSLGPAIDAQTGGASKSLTAQAASTYANLAQITAAGSSAQDATNASLYAHQMQALYTAAIALPSGGPVTPPVTPPLTVGPTLAPTPTAAAAGSSMTVWLLGGAAVALGVGGWWYLRRRK
jgi:LPXTG-motif cell wall-anchored protein